MIELCNDDSKINCYLYFQRLNKKYNHSFLDFRITYFKLCIS